MQEKALFYRFAFVIITEKVGENMLKYKCLVLDHDDTVVQSEDTINYPFFCYILDQFRPGEKITPEEYAYGCYHTGFTQMCTEKYGFTEQEQEEEYLGWKEYIRTHIPAPYEGIERIIHRQKELGGIICVVSHSSEENIKRDYAAHFNLQPDEIFGWDYPAHQRKPNPYPIEQIMKKYNLAKEDILIVDDMKPAWEMAQKTNVPIAFAGWGRLHYPAIVEEMSRLCDYSFLSVDALYTFLFGTH